MKNTLVILGLILTQNVFAKDYFYKVEENDQLGIILLSLGHKKLWPKDGQVNLFKRQFKLKLPNKIYKGNVLKFSEQDILFKNNIIIKDDYFTFKKTIKNLEQYATYAQKENTPLEQSEERTPPSVEIIKDPSQAITTLPEEKESTHSLSLYPALGFFVANNKENDQQSSTTTFTGLQPMVQLKAIYSNSSFGSFSADLLTKKILKSGESFPINFDYRLQLVPIWNFTDYFRFAVSHSVLAHSYAGKHLNSDITYKLTSNFLGLGFIIPKNNYWLELYFEKSYTGKTVSSKNTQKTSNGFRIDSELVYPISEKFKILPGINYYSVKDNSTLYKLNVLETRLTLAREFDF